MIGNQCRCVCLYDDEMVVVKTVVVNTTMQIFRLQELIAGEGKMVKEDEMS